MKNFNSTFVLRLGIAIIFFSHSLHGIINNDVTNFGDLFLNQIGFAPFGVFTVWLVILSQVIGSLFIDIRQVCKIDFHCIYFYTH